MHLEVKADFWDINDMANKIISVLQHAPLHEELKENTIKEAYKFSLDEPAIKTIDCYNKVIR